MKRIITILALFFFSLGMMAQTGLRNNYTEPYFQGRVAVADSTWFFKYCKVIGILDIDTNATYNTAHIDIYRVRTLQRKGTSLLLGNITNTSWVGSYNTILGDMTLDSLESLNNSIMSGYGVAAKADTVINVVLMGPLVGSMAEKIAYVIGIGNQTIRRAKVLNYVTAIGNKALEKADTIEYTVAVGPLTLYDTTNYYQVTALGYNAGASLGSIQKGDTASLFLGHNARGLDYSTIVGNELQGLADSTIMIGAAGQTAIKTRINKDTTTFYTGFCYDDQLFHMIKTGTLVNDDSAFFITFNADGWGHFWEHTTGGSIEYAEFLFDEDNGMTLINNSEGVVTSSTAEKIALIFDRNYKGYIKNRTGSTIHYRLVYWYKRQ